MKIKLTINSENRSVIIPMEYEQDTDSLSFEEIQIDPVPEKNEDVSKDIVLNLTHFIVSSFNNL